MPVLQLDELGPAVVRPLSDDVGRALAESRIVDARPAAGSRGRWEIRAAGWVGAATVAGVELRVRPKVEIDRLLYLLGYALDPKGWRDDTVSAEAERDLLPAFAEAVSRQTDQALRAGLLQGYVRVEDALPVVRGRIREADQIRRRYGQALPVEVTFDEFTVDIPENRILVTAIDRLLGVAGVHPLARRRLLHLRARLAEVTPLVRGTQVPRWQPTRLNQRYWVALRLAEMVISASSPDASRGVSWSSGFMFSMPKVFEDFVTVSLGERLSEIGGRAVRQDAAWHLDTGEQVSLRPDLVWYCDGRPAAVVDAKYKAEKPEGFPNADVYQALAYCLALGLDRCHLVYAAGNEQSRTYRIDTAGVTVVAHALDLAREAAMIQRQITGIAGQLAASRSSAADRSRVC